MNWKRWKFGFVVAAITGLCTALAVGVIVPSMTLKEGLLVCLASIAKDVLLFLKQHPADEVSFETTQIKKP
jgi:hypothetical protein